MKTLSQSTFTRLSEEKILEQIESPATLLNIQNPERGYVHYHVAGEELKVGAIVKYFLVYGLQQIRWSSPVVSFSHDQIKTKGGSGPFQKWEAIHSWVKDGDGMIVRDFLRFECEEAHEEFSDILEASVLDLGLEDLAIQEQAKRTAKFRALGIESA